MTLGGNGITGSGRDRRRVFACALSAMLVLMLVSGIPAVVSAQMFTDRPPPIPPALVPEPSGGAMSLAPPSGPASTPNLPAPLTQPPPVAAIPPVIAAPGTSTAGQAVLSLTARYGKDLPVINSGLVWRGFSGRAAAGGYLI